MVAHSHPDHENSPSSPKLEGEKPEKKGTPKQKARLPVIHHIPFLSKIKQSKHHAYLWARLNPELQKLIAAKESKEELFLKVFSQMEIRDLKNPEKKNSFEQRLKDIAA